MKTKKELVIITFLVIFSTLLVWLPFSFKNQFLKVFANYDGPNYIVVAKTWYNKDLIEKHFALPSPPEYYPSHFPGYPALIRLLDLFLPGTWAMLISALLTTILASTVFYLFVKKFNLSPQPLWLTTIFLFLPARFLVVRSVGSPEPLFIFAILASFYFFRLKKWWLAGIFGALAQITKSPGILLFVTYGIIIFVRGLKTKKIPWEVYPLLLIPLSALGVFIFYLFQTGDFLAYFHSGDNFHLVFPPFQSFNTGKPWLGDFWLEDMIYIYLLGALTVVQLIKLKQFDLATFAGIFYTATLFIAHRDLSRYSLPLAPFALIAFSDFLEKKEFKIAFWVVLAGIYLYAINFITHNTAPIADWTPYL
ncbi:MAG: hypothetical protein ACPLXP_00545 [Microgenomates group bacterium]